jgi:hypothetical protein
LIVGKTGIPTDFQEVWYIGTPFCFLLFDSEVRASNSQKQNTVTVSAWSGSELKLKTG